MLLAGLLREVIGHRADLGVAVALRDLLHERGRPLAVAKLRHEIDDLVFRAARGSARVMPAVGVCILAAHYLDVYWLIVPSMRPAWAIADVIWDAAALAFVVGSVTAVVAWRQATTPAVASEDPLLKSSLAYEAH